MAPFVRTICIDFDGVIHSYTSGWKGADVIADPPVPGAAEWLNAMIESPDFEPVIYSSRSKEPGAVEAMRKYITDMGVDANKLDFPTKKPAAFLTVDDRAVCFTGVFPSLLEMKTFKPWNKK